jgi:predicted MPP superfamily phosphohydrolase
VGFIIFLLVFLSLYSGLHLYGFLKVKRALPFGPAATTTLIVFMAIMIFAPILVRILERMGSESMARLLAYIGYSWMGLLFLFFSSALLLDFYRLLLSIARLILSADLSFLTLSPRQSFLIPFFLSLLITVYGSFEAVSIRQEYITFNSPKIPPEVGRIRIAQISDVHLGLIMGKKRLERIIRKIKTANPDILVSTGDLVDGQANNLSDLADMLQKTTTKYGKFAITGNHEFYAGLAHSIDFTEKAGFTILRGNGLNVSGLLNIAGVDDIAGKTYGLMKQVSEKVMLSKLPRNLFTLFLKHRPLLDKEARGLFDLQLSGHTHKGQIFPFSLITKLFFPNQAGLLALENNTHLYVSRGTGTWGPPIRFLASPEVTIIDLVHQ